jgi:hypothetical protein
VVSIAELVDYPDKGPATVGAIVTNLRLRMVSCAEIRTDIAQSLERSDMEREEHDDEWS